MNSKEEKEINNESFLFFPIDAYFDVSNALTAAIYSYRINSKFSTDQPFSTIFELLNFDSEEYPKFIRISGTGRTKSQTQLFFLTRILAMLILLSFDYNGYRFIVILAKKLANDHSVALKKLAKDPIDALNMLTDLKKSMIRDNIDQLINLLIIFIEFSDYEIESISKFIYSFNSLFLPLIDLHQYGQNEMLNLKEKLDDDDNDEEKSFGINIIKAKKVDKNVDSNNLRYYFLSSNDIKENSYGAIITTNKIFCLSTTPREMIFNDSINNDNVKVNYEINLSYEKENEFIKSLVNMPSFKKSIGDKDDDDTNKSNAEFSHFNYFTQKMEVIYNHIKTKISERYMQEDQIKDPINEFYSIIYNITIFNYYIARTTKSNLKKYEKVDDTSFISNFLGIENYLIILLESINQCDSPYLFFDIEYCIYQIYQTYEYLKKKIKTEAKEENEQIIQYLHKLSLILVLSAVKNKISKTTKKYFIDMLINLIKSNDEKKWSKKYFGYNPTDKDKTEASKNISGSFQNAHNIFKADLKVGTLMKQFHLVSCTFIIHNQCEIIDIMNDIEKYDIQFK